MYDLIISDPHVSPGQDLSRFEWLGRMIVEERPRAIICLGDFGSFDSLSQHEKAGSKKDRNAPDLESDFDVCCKAQSLMFREMFKDYDKSREHRHLPKYGRIRHVVKGNHEERYDRWAEANPRISTAIDFSAKMEYLKYWTGTTEYRDYFELDKIGYTHIPLTKMGKPFGGVLPNRTIALNSAMPIIFGHTHNFGVYSLGLIQNNGVRMVVNAPAFMPDQHIEDYAQGTQTGWVYGLLKVWPSGEYLVPPDIETVSIRRLEAMYG